MFSLNGRHNYDGAEIRHRESLLHVLDRAGTAVLWRDNQSGCKGVCDGLTVEKIPVSADAALCEAGRCFDEILLEGLQEKIDASRGDIVIVLHMLGNHGPATTSVTSRITANGARPATPPTFPVVRTRR